jgi:DNA-directed RNA polymerase alpha subunit
MNTSGLPDFGSDNGDLQQRATLARIVDRETSDPLLAALMRGIICSNPAWHKAALNDAQFPRLVYLMAKSVSIVLTESTDEVSIEELDLKIRGFNVLRREGVHTVGALTRLTRNDLLDMRNMGVGAADDIEERLSRLGRTLKETR